LGIYLTGLIRIHVYLNSWVTVEKVTVDIQDGIMGKSISSYRTKGIIYHNPDSTQLSISELWLQFRKHPIILVLGTGNLQQRWKKNPLPPTRWKHSSDKSPRVRTCDAAEHSFSDTAGGLREI